MHIWLISLLAFAVACGGSPQEPVSEPSPTPPAVAPTPAPGAVTEAEKPVAPPPSAAPAAAAEATRAPDKVSFCGKEFEPTETRATCTASRPMVLTGIEGFTALEELTLEGGGITDLGPLAKLAHLRTLTLDDTAVRDLSPLAGVATLRELSLGRVTSQSVLTSLARLQQLRKLRTVALPTFEPLAALPGLLVLDARLATGTDLRHLSALTDLCKLDLRGVPLDRQQLAIIGGLRQLQELNLSSAGIADIKALAPLRQLVDLDLSDNPIANVSTLHGLRHADQIDLRSTRVSARRAKKLARKSTINHLYHGEGEHLVGKQRSEELLPCALRVQLEPKSE